MGDSPGTRTLLGFDYGKKRIGVAVGQQLTSSANPLTTVTAHAGKPDWDAIGKLIQEWKPDALVVGIPYHMDGTEQEMTRAARRFCRQLEGRFRIPVHEADERLSSWLVEQQQGLQGDIDPQAARVILEDWLQQKKIQT